MYSGELLLLMLRKKLRIIMFEIRYIDFVQEISSCNIVMQFLYIVESASVNIR